MADINYKPPPSLGRLITHFRFTAGSMGKACEVISRKLKFKWSGKYIYQIWKGSKPATQQFKNYINRLDQKVFKEKRIWLKVQALDEEQKDRWRTHSMEERRKALDGMDK